MQGMELFVSYVYVLVLTQCTIRANMCESLFKRPGYNKPRSGSVPLSLKDQLFQLFCRVSPYCTYLMVSNIYLLRPVKDPVASGQTKILNRSLLWTDHSKICSYYHE